MILYHNTVSGQLSLSLYEVRQAMPHCSIPDGTTVVGDFVAYSSSVEPTITWSQRLVEQVPVNGQQVWQTESLSVLEIDAKTIAKSNELRMMRDQLLRDCDWTQLTDVALSPTQIADWRIFRQSLRDVTLQPGYPWSVIWPQPPIA